MSKTTVIEEFDSEGNLVKKTTVTENDAAPTYAPITHTSPGYPGQIIAWNTDNANGDKLRS